MHSYIILLRLLLLLLPPTITITSTDTILLPLSHLFLFLFFRFTSFLAWIPQPQFHNSLPRNKWRSVTRKKKQKNPIFRQKAEKRSPRSLQIDRRNRSITYSDNVHRLALDLFLLEPEEAQEARGRRKGRGKGHTEMASSGKQLATGGGETSGGPKMGRTLSRKMTRMPTMLDVQQEEDVPAPADSELVPASLASIVPILRVANEIEKDNPRVAYLCKNSTLL